MDDPGSDGRAPKRARLGHGQLDGASEDQATTHFGDSGANTSSSKTDNTRTLDDSLKERQVGITAFVDDSLCHVFRGVLKKRYTDFLVNEILPDGGVLHLCNTRVVKEDEAATSSSNGNGSTLQSRHADVEAPPTDTSGHALRDPTLRATEPIGYQAKLDEDGDQLLPNGKIADEDRSKLVGYFSEEAVDQIIALYEAILRAPEKKARDQPTVRTAFTSDRALRSQIHQDIRRIFSGKIDSSTDKDGVLMLSAAALNPPKRGGPRFGDKGRPGKLGWMDRGGEYVHFSLYKENKDTLEVVSFLTKQLKTNNKTFQFAGTKDRRAVTVQRVSAFRVEAERLAALNRTLRYAAIGDFEYQKRGLELGDLQGNEFVVTLRNCEMALPEDVVGLEQVAATRRYLSHSMQSLRDNGFHNYFGLQRFGTFNTRTDVVGLKILQGDFKGACDAILEFSPAALEPDQGGAQGQGKSFVDRDDRYRAEGINLWQSTGRINDALNKIPRKFSAEAALIRHLGRHPQDSLGALLSITRNLRLIYVHAYQSLVWNLAVGERWRLYGNRVVEGDLVLVSEHKDKISTVQGNAEPHVDADGELIVQPSGDDRSYELDDMFERARALTAEEAQSGRYSTFDLVLPLPGFDVLYPANACGEWYKTFMASDAGGGLDPHDMRRKHRDFSLSGGYRKILARIGQDYDVQVYEYVDDATQFVETDLERIKKQTKFGATDTSGNQDAASEDTGVATGNLPETNDARKASKVAAVLKFQLGSSTYATMALRELSRGGIQSYKAEFTGGR